MTRARRPPPAPWDCRLEAVVWWHRAHPGAIATLPAGLGGRARVPVTAGALISYLDTPVGPYREVLCSPAVVLDGVVPAAHVPFIAVDSAASLQGGRDNWALPKVPGVFSWSPHAAAARDPDGGWSVEARVRPRALRLPVALAARCVQESERGERVAFPVRGRGLAAPARVCVAAGGPACPEWLVVGVHVGVRVTAARVHVGRPRP